MTQAFVYGTFNQAKCWNQHKYSDGTEHVVAKLASHLSPGGSGAWALPMDFGDISGASEVHCQVSDNVAKIHVTHYNGVCGKAFANTVAPYGVVCNLIADNGTIIGAMLYGHLLKNSRLAPGIYNKHPSHFRDGGWIIGFPAPNCHCPKCADGVHVHAQAANATKYVSQFFDNMPVGRGHKVWEFNF